MKKIYTIGIDIGGTNTDAVLLDAKKNIIHSIKVATTDPLEEGFCLALTKLIALSGIEPESVKAIFVGTTHATNAILQCRELYKVGVIRLAGHHPITLPVCYGWPTSLRQTVLADTVNVDGGYECDGRMLTALDPNQIKLAVQKLINMGAESLAICGVFSPLHMQQEDLVEKIIRHDMCKDLPISLSNQIGGIGFIERENATILNASLKKVMKNGFKRLNDISKSLGMNCPLHVTQNNGSVITLEHATEYPILTLSAGPTNSFVGAVKLAGLKDAIIVDIGGTSTDIGIVQNGFARRCLNNSTIGGVKLNFATPDVLSIALGGGSHVVMDEENLQIGPESCARLLQKESQAFGGSLLTLTDASISLGQIIIDGASPNKVKLSKKDALRVFQKACLTIDRLVSRMEGVHKDLPIILVGGGAKLIPKECLSERYRIPDYANVANAYGAALAEYALTVTTVISLEKRDEVLKKLKEEAMEAVKAKGACPHSSRIVDVGMVPYHYMPGNMARVTITAAGPQNS